MKKKITAIVLIIAMLAIIAGSTMAYFVDTSERTNTIVIGNVAIELYESRYHRGATGDSYLKITGQPEPLTDADIIADNERYADYLDGATLMPFDLSKNQTMFEECTVAKNAYVKNTGKNDCFVRVRYLIPAEIAPYLDIFYVDTQFIADNDAVATADARTLNNGDQTEPVITVATPSGADFTQQGAEKITVDGKEYYYIDFIYAERLRPNEMTLYSPISKITMIPSVTSDILARLNLQDLMFEIKVEAHAIQADGFLNAVTAFAAFDLQET